MFSRGTKWIEHEFMYFSVYIYSHTCICIYTGIYRADRNRKKMKWGQGKKWSFAVFLYFERASFPCLTTYLQCSSGWLQNCANPAGPVSQVPVDITPSKRFVDLSSFVKISSCSCEGMLSPVDLLVDPQSHLLAEFLLVSF